jgi:hypothetical protein
MFPLLARLRNRTGRPPLRVLRNLAVAGALGAAGLSAAPAADPPASAPEVSDVLLARSALTALDADPQLRDVNLVVSVVDRVAVVGGPVSSADLGRRAEGLVRRVPGITDVRNRCFVDQGVDPLIRAMASHLPAAPRQPLATELPGVVASPKTGLVEEVTLPPESNLVAVVPRERTVVSLKPTTPGDNILLPPVAPHGPVAPAVTPAVPPGTLTSVPPVTPPAAIPGRPGDALLAADAVRKADRRFAGLTLELRSGMLVIAGTAAKASDAWDLAQELRRIPGVARVALGNVDVK